jgi:hypothetical protein
MLLRAKGRLTSIGDSRKAARDAFLPDHARTIRAFRQVARVRSTPERRGKRPLRLCGSFALCRALSLKRTVADVVRYGDAAGGAPDVSC